MNAHLMHIFVLLNMLIFNNFDTAYTKSMSALEKTIKSKSFNQNTLTVTVIEIMTMCFSRVADKIIFAGDWVDFSTLHRLTAHLFSINIIGMSQSSTFRRHQRLKGFYELNEQVVRKLRYPAQLFVVSISSRSFDDLLSRVKDSIFWNAEATFLFVDEDPLSPCSNAIWILDIVWKFNILQAVYMCRQTDGKILFYNFNPFTDLAPVPWEPVDIIINTRRNHPIIFYRIVFEDLNIDSSFCNKLHYSKDSLLTGYPLRLCGIRDSMFLDEIRESSKEHRDLDDFDGIDVNVARIIWTKLKAHPTLKIIGESGFVENNVPYGLVKSIIEGEFDVGVNQYFMRSFWRLQTYPHGVENLCILSLENCASQNLAMTLWIFEPMVICIIAFASILITIMLKYLLRVSLDQAFLVVLSMLLGLSTHLPKTLGSRINLCYVMFFMFGLNVYLNCSLTSFLVAPHDVLNIDSLDDISKHRYNAIGAAYVKEYITDKSFVKLFNVGHTDDCLSKIKANYKVVCIKTCVHGVYYKKMHNYLHLSKSIQSISRTFLIREDWPLRNKFNFIVQNMLETGIFHYLRQMETYTFHSASEVYDRQKENDSYSPVRKETMTFVWYTLSIGILLSFVTFFTELLIYQLTRPSLNIQQTANQNMTEFPTSENLINRVCIFKNTSFLIRNKLSN